MRKFWFPSSQVRVLAVVVTMVGCEPSSPFVDASAETASSETGDDPGGSSSGTTTSMPGETGSGGDESTSDPGNGFIQPLDGGSPSHECSTWTQNCPGGQKCTFWANDGGSSWNATRCVEIAPDADQAGEPCTVEGSGVTGLDTCEIGAMCWDVDPETNEGTCVDFCTGGESNPVCADPTMFCVGRGPYLCLPSCCPLERDCPEGQACYPVFHDFLCAPDASGDTGGFGEPCEFINSCDPGMLCASAETVPNCAGTQGCCTAFCEVGSSSCSLLHPDLECTPWYGEGDAPPGQDHIGACLST